MKIMDLIEELRKDVKQILIQTTKTNGRVGYLEKYKENKLEPIVNDYWENRGVVKEKKRILSWRKFLIGTFGLAGVSVLLFMINVVVDKSVERSMTERLNERDNAIAERVIEEFKNLEFEVELEQ